MAVKLSPVERQILYNQHRILGFLEPKEKDWHERACRILESGYERDYNDVVNVQEEVTDPADIEEVMEVFEMHQALQDAYDAAQDKLGVEAEDVLLLGFDGNAGKGKLGYATFVRKNDGFASVRIALKDLNSHMPTDDIHQRMLAVWKPLGRNRLHLTVQQVKSIVAARIHPSHRSAEA